MESILEGVLDLLAEQDRSGARELLDTVSRTGPEAPAARALHRLLDPAPAARFAGEPIDSTPTNSPRARLFERTAEASQALREGRVEELVAGARTVWAAAAAEHPWVQLRGASLLQAAFRFTGEADVFQEAVGACTRVGDRTKAPRIAVFGRALLGSLHMMAGRLHAAMDRLEAALGLAEARTIGETSPAALAWQFRGYVLWEWNRLEAAEESLRGAWARTTENDRGIRSGVARVLATLTAALGRVEESDAWLRELEAVVAEPMTLRNREWIAAVRLTQAVLVSRAPGVEAERRRAGVREVERWRRSWSYDLPEVMGWTDAHLRTRLHELGHALTLLELTSQWETVRALAVRVEAGVGELREGFRIHAVTVRAVALENLGRSAEADQAWAEALARGEGEGFVRTYVDGSDPRARLHRRALADPGTRSQAERISRAAGGWPDSDDAVELTTRQLDVLRRLAEGDSNRTAAAALGIAETTVKTHVRALLTRLGAESRTQAVAFARRRGLL